MRRSPREQGQGRISVAHAKRAIELKKARLRRRAKTFSHRAKDAKNEAGGTEIRPGAQEQPPEPQPLGAAAQQVVDDLRLGLIEEAADLAIPFLVSVRQHARPW